MSLLRPFSFLAIALSFAGIGLSATPAHAVICCSAEICQSDNPPALCYKCSPSCADDEQAAVDGEIVYDEVESLCYVAGDLDSAEGEHGEQGGCE